MLTPRGAPAALLLLVLRVAPGAAQSPEATLAPVLVTAPPPVASSSEQLIPGRDFELRPHGRPADVLRLVPGLIIDQHQGGGKAEQYLLRGFDADHGTDLALFVDGVPATISLLDWLTFKGDFTWTRPAEFVDTGFPIPLAPCWTARAELTARLPWGLSTSAEMRYLGDRVADDFGFHTARGYTLFNRNARYHHKNMEEAFLSI